MNAKIETATSQPQGVLVQSPRSRFDLSIATAEQFEQVNAAANVAVTFSPAQAAASPKAVHVHLSGSKTETMCVWSTQSKSGFQSRPRVLEDKVTIRFVASGAMSRGTVRGGDLVAAFGQAVFAPFGEMSLADTTPGFSSLSVSINQAALAKKFIALGSDRALELPHFDQVVDASSPRMLALRNTLELLRCQLLTPHEAVDLVSPLLEEMVAYQILSAWPAMGEPVDVKAASIPDRTARTAIDFIEANLANKIEIADIASAAGVSVRVLQMAFKTRLGCAPSHFLIFRRLDKVRAALIDGIPLSIAQIARHWGFAHMSDFSQRYCARFGELPRETRLKISDRVRSAAIPPYIVHRPRC